MCMRTNIVLDDDLLGEAMKYSSARTKRGVVAEALATYVTVKEEEHRRARYKDRLGDVRARLLKGKPLTSAHELIRAERERTT